MIGHYEQLLGPGDVPGVALCVTVVAGLSVEEALVRFDGFPPRHTAAVADLSEVALAAPFRYPHLAKAVAVDGAVILIEDNGYHGAQAETMARLSEGTVATSVYWNVNFTNRLTHAAGGRLVGALDWADTGRRWGDHPTVLDPWLDGLGFDVPGDPRPKALSFLERASGVRLTREHFLDEHPASVLVPARLFEPRASLSNVLPGVVDVVALVGLPPTMESIRSAGLRAALRAATELAVDGLLTPDAPVPDPSTLPDDARERHRAALLGSARQEYRRGVERAWDAYDEGDDDEPTGGSIDDLVAELDGESDWRRAAVHQTFAYAAARSRLHADPMTALTTTLANAATADPDGHPARRDRVHEFLSGACRPG